ncbi:hypothetical protein BLOT_009287 [Blomia tropicalis]|nr:hypothetical protein BLOT_009287 [Blomia tropicalis]
MTLFYSQLPTNNGKLDINEFLIATKLSFQTCRFLICDENIHQFSWPHDSNIQLPLEAIFIGRDSVRMRTE